MKNIDIKNLNDLELKYYQEVIDYIEKYLRRLKRIQHKLQPIKNTIENMKTNDLENQIKSKIGNNMNELNLSEFYLNDDVKMDNTND